MCGFFVISIFHCHRNWPFLTLFFFFIRFYYFYYYYHHMYDCVWIWITLTLILYFFIQHAIFFYCQKWNFFFVHSRDKQTIKKRQKCPFGKWKVYFGVKEKILEWCYRNFLASSYVTCCNKIYSHNFSSNYFFFLSYFFLSFSGVYKCLFRSCEIFFLLFCWLLNWNCCVIGYGV